MVALPHRINREPDLALVLAPLSADRVAGQPVAEDPDYAWLDEELIKVGSLQHGGIDWAGAERRAIRLLSGLGKDLRVLAHLLHCLQREGDATRFELALLLLQRCLGTWWSEAHPAPGDRGSRWRTRLFSTIVRRAAALAEGLEGAAAPTLRRCRHAVDGLRSATQDAGLSPHPLAELDQALVRVTPAPRTAPPADDPGQGEQAPRHQPPAPEKPSAGARIPELRPGNERANREALQRVADHLNDQSPDHPLGYRLRRYALWRSIDTLPPARDGQRTELAPMAADLAARYREAVQGRGDHALWARLEQSLAVSPFWLEGHRLSAEMARQLGHEPCARAIREETAHFIACLPGLVDLRFSDGSPFADEATRCWLAEEAAAGIAQNGAGEPWDRALAEARESLAEDGLAAALERLDRGLAAAGSPRASAYWRLASADLLHHAGLQALAHQQYQAVHSVVRGLALERWEPHLVKRLEAIGPR
ncbi:type VI secretion system protein TssA [Alkalilimnicola ehrlichii MLHE-1]|nr:type VI secretion system protein TssA [Alkalilimnicola ehrlichii]